MSKLHKGDIKVLYFKPDEAEALEKKGYILDPEKQNTEDITDESLKPYYEKLKHEYFDVKVDDPDVKKVYEHIDPSHENKITYYGDIFKTVKEDGFEYLSVDVGTKFYKGTQYYYKDLLKKNFWVGALRIAKNFANASFGGLMVYKITRPLKLLVLSYENLEKIYDKAPKEIKTLLEIEYGVRVPLERQIHEILAHNPRWKDSLWLYNEHYIEKSDPYRFRFLGAGRDFPFHTWLYENYDFDGTFVPYYISPFGTTHDEEVNLNHKSQAFELDKTDPNYWENWGINLPDPKLFMLNEHYNNYNWRTIRWYNNSEKLSIPKTEGIKLLSFNVKGFSSGNALHDNNKTFHQFLEFLDKISPDIVVVQEFERSYLDKLPKKYHKFSVPNGGGGLCVVVLTINPAVFKFIEFKARMPRNSILVEYRGHDGKTTKIIGTHLDIGERYASRFNMNGYGDFYRKFKSNVRLRSEQLKKLISYSPDIIIGDFNFNPENPELAVMTNAGYVYDETGPSSIYGKKVDFAFYKPSAVAGTDYLLDYYESDHKPLLFDFEKSESVNGVGVGGGGGGVNDNMMHTIHYFTPERRKELIDKGFVLDQEIKDSLAIGKDKSLMDVYEKTKNEYLGRTCETANCVQYAEHISKKPPYVFFADIGKYEKDPDGFTYFVIPPDTKTYKGTKYFYDSFPKTHFWVGCQKLAMDYAEWYGGGLNIYRNKKPMRLLVLNKENLEKIYNEATDTQAKELLQMIYGIGISIEDQTKWICKKNPQWCGKIWLYDEHFGLRDDPKPNQYMPVWGSNLIHDYFYDKYHFDGTFLEYFMSPFREIMDEEISINIGVGKNGENLRDNIEMLKDDPDYWENWGLKLPDAKEFLLNESYPPNIGFKVNDWYRSVIPSKELFVDVGHDIQIMSYNVRFLTSANVLKSKDEILDNLIQLVNLSDANIIFLQELPAEHLERLRQLKQFQVISTMNGGYELLLVALVNLKKGKFTKFDIIKDKKKSVRNSIVLNYIANNKPIRIIGTHLEIGGRYMKNTRFIDYAEFCDVYKRNVATRSEQLKKILSHSPNIVIGDFNFSPDDPELEVMTDAKFKYNETEPTSIHKKKVDYAFYDKSISGKSTLIDYYESDHKPLVFSFKVDSGLNVAGGFNLVNQLAVVKPPFLFMLIISVLIVAIIILLWYWAYKKICDPHHNSQVLDNGSLQTALDGESSMKYLELSPA